MLKQLCIFAVCATLCACDQPEQSNAVDAAAQVTAQNQDAQQSAANASAQDVEDILSALPQDAQARIPYRNPKETLEFFGVVPGMTVVDTVPGDIWYAGILAAYLGPGGKIIGADRPISVWEYFGAEYSPPEFLAKRAQWPITWPQRQAERNPDRQVAFSAVAFGKVPDTLASTVDVVMMVREFHNLMGADNTGALLDTVLGEINMMLKPGGVFAVVQHRAPEAASDAWANGSNGYVKRSQLVAFVEAAGFILEAESDINANPNDQPTEKEAVWRLPPGLDVPEGDTQARSAMIAIGESDRMTLRFRKKL